MVSDHRTGQNMALGCFGAIGLCLITVCGLGFLGWFGVRSDRDALATADRLWDQGRHAEAVEKYKDVIKSSVLSINEIDRPRVFQRAIEFEVQRGDIATAGALIERGLRHNVKIVLSDPAALELLAQAQPGTVVPRKSTAAAKPTAPGVRDQQEVELQRKVAELDKKLSAITKVLGDLESEKKEICAKLAKAGVKSSADLKDNPVAQLQAKRLTEVVQQLEGYQRVQTEYATALEQGKAVHRDYVRLLELKQAGVGEEDIVKVTTAIKQIDEKLKDVGAVPVTPLKVEEVLEKELKVSN